MNKYTWDGKKIKLSGHLIKTGENMSFELLDRDGNEITITPEYGITVISTFPELNTTICDQQSEWMAEIAEKHPDISFISISTDTPDTINQWCNARKLKNLRAYSDFKRDFGHKTNTLIKRLDELARGFIIFKEGVLTEISYNSEVQTEPDYKIVESYL